MAASERIEVLSRLKAELTKYLELTKNQNAIIRQGDLETGRLEYNIKLRQGVIDSVDGLNAQLAKLPAASGGEAELLLREIGEILTQAHKLDKDNIMLAHGQKDFFQSEVKRLRLGRETIGRYHGTGMMQDSALFDKKQ